MPRPGLRLSEPERRNLAADYQNARFHKDLDMCLRIQALVLVNRAIARPTLQMRLGWDAAPFKFGFTGSEKEVFRD